MKLPYFSTVNSKEANFPFPIFQVYPRAPFVFLTAVHKSAQGASTPDNRHDAAIVWAGDVALDKFRACVRELKNFDGIHKKVHVVSEAFKKRTYNNLFNKRCGWGIALKVDKKTEMHFKFFWPNLNMISK